MCFSYWKILSIEGEMASTWLVMYTVQDAALLFSAQRAMLQYGLPILVLLGALWGIGKGISFWLHQKAKTRAQEDIPESDFTPYQALPYQQHAGTQYRCLF